MRTIILRTFRSRVAAVFGLLVAVNIAAWVWASCTFHGNAVLLGTAFVAFTLGLRHAADADHIAAIDNVTRKLMQDGHRPLSVGFYFALGHSTVVLIASLGIFLTATAIETHLSQFREIGAIFGTLVSSLFMVVNCGDEPAHSHGYLQDVPAGKEWRKLYRTESRPYLGRGRVNDAVLQARFSDAFKKLANVPCRIPVWPWLRHGD